ncbi:phosphotransferase enzyme family protein [Aspergillus nomiae NRRL 13137]|uniref:Phosphotransferase enzyme family protein n=1 Tax=Aspergillus nomiae NRRL (strain ATCC 15546 / NRRL 13137 / CBS 260.88 / M93) TaxID=1509407 RepID=A0A0L1IMJ1_ASPN3|nr:phosphotransferase enzyme family protein [Aspergillus nomiae NRRL 13137]KNG80398.1 phosphotransferase enzyme family protein [Aspergillus nomiae NRRL 13137]
MVTYRLGDQLISLELPDATKKEIDFTDSSFFKTPNRHLPTPDQVRAISPDVRNRYKITPVRFENLNLIVKSGVDVTTIEAVNLWMIKKVFQNDVPVPEVFGWRVDDEGFVFIYMELIKGPTLEECRVCLDTTQKKAITDQLSRIMGNLRRLKQDTSDPFVGRTFKNQPKTGPIPSAKEFNDWFALLPSIFLCQRSDKPYRCFLPDTDEIKFTHADLHKGNMIVSSFDPVQIVIVDWAQSGWYPDYWEYCRACWTCKKGDEWHEDFVAEFLEPRKELDEVFAYYCYAIGAYS